MITISMLISLVKILFSNQVYHSKYTVKWFNILAEIVKSLYNRGEKLLIDELIDYTN